MAPRRGGGGGGFGSSGSSVENRCAIVGAFSDDYSRGIIAENAIFLVALIIVAAFYLMARPRNPRMKTVLRWYLYGLGLLLAILSYVVYIIQMVLQECLIFDDSYADIYKISAVVSWFSFVSKILIQALILLPLCASLFAIAGIKFGLVKWIHVAQLVIITVLGIARTGIRTYYYANQFSNSFRFNDGLYDSLTRLGAAFSFLLFVSTVSAAVASIYAITKIKARGIAVGGLLVWVIIVMIALVGYHLVDFASIAHYSLPSSPPEYTREADLAIEAISGIFQIATFLGLVLVTRSQAIKTWDGNNAAAYVAHNKEAPPHQYAPVPAPASYSYQQQPVPQPYGNHPMY